MDSRQEFEEWFASQFDAKLGTILPNLQYSNCDANCLWDAWQAARKPKHTREDIVKWLLGDTRSQEPEIKEAVDYLIEAGIITVNEKGKLK